MNALELADWLETYNWIPDDAVWINKATTMLREQQAEIEALKKVLQEVVRISDRNHDAWNKAKELLK